MYGVAATAAENKINALSESINGIGENKYA